MAGVKLQVSYDDKALQRGLRDLYKKTGDLEHYFRDVGEYLKSEADERFKTETTPEGAKWAPLSDAYATYKSEKKGDSAKILTFDAHLRRLQYKVGKRDLELGTTMIYGAIHQCGGKAGPGRKVKIPARPYLGLSAEAETELLALLEDHLGL